MKNQDNKIFLHACCGPCAQWPLSVLISEDLSPTLYYGNPNIHPHIEWKRRKAGLEEVCRLRHVPLIIDDAFAQDLWNNVRWKENYPSRCEMCYELRMTMAAKAAKNAGFKLFTTTLLVSVYQDHEAIVKAAEKAAKEVGISFYYKDFRSGFRTGQSMAREAGIYRQKYCGCIDSLEASDFRDKIYQSFESDFE